VRNQFPLTYSQTIKGLCEAFLVKASNWVKDVLHRQNGSKQVCRLIDYCWGCGPKAPKGSLSLTAHVALRKYELTVSPSFLITSFHWATETISTMEVPINHSAGGPRWWRMVPGAMMALEAQPMLKPSETAKQRRHSNGHTSVADRFNIKCLHVVNVCNDTLVVHSMWD
jgi:hypothetical protein